MEQPFPCPLLWGAMVGVALFAPVVVAEEGGRHSRPDARIVSSSWAGPNRSVYHSTRSPSASTVAS
jgi:hypothetical protein